MKNNTHKKISIPMKNNTHKKISIPMKNNSQTFQQNFHTHKKWAYPILSAYQTHNQSKIVQQCPKIISNTKLNQWPTLSELRNTKELNNSKMPQNKNQDDHTKISIQIIQYPKIPTRANNNIWQRRTIKFSTKHEINKFTNKKQKMSSPWNLFCMSVEHGCLGLEGVPLHRSILGMDDTSSH